MARPGEDPIAVTLRRNDVRLVLGAVIAEAGMHSREGRHATAAWAHDVAAKIADAIGDEAMAAEQRHMAGTCSNEWHESQEAKEKAKAEGFAKRQAEIREIYGDDDPTQPPRHGPY